MNSVTFRNLAIVFFALLAILIGLEMSGRDSAAPVSGALFPELKARINAVDRLVVEAPGESPLTVSKDADTGAWAVENRADFPANVGKIREVLLALADAKILEEKTSNPERYPALGVTEPDVEDSRGTRLTVSGDGFSEVLIVGDANQSSNRYVRPAGQALSLLIDKDPKLPGSTGDWLRSGLLDIETARVSRVSIRHADDELIEMSKSAAEDTEFDVYDIPADRELSYPTVVNGMAAVLSDLRLADVRPAEEQAVNTVSGFETFDGLRVTVRTTGLDDDRWITISASTVDGSIAANGESLSSPDEPAAQEAVVDSSADADESKPDPVQEAADINARLAGWQFRVESYKLDQLTRRWDDLLKAVED